MAQLLIRLTDRTHPVPSVASTLYRRGDVIDVFEDGQLTVPQPVPHWAVLTVTGLSVAQAKAVLLPPAEDRDPTTDEPTLVLRRARGLNWSALPGNLRNRLTNDRFATVTLTDVAARVIDRRTGVVVAI